MEEALAMLDQYLDDAVHAGAGTNPEVGMGVGASSSANGSTAAIKSTGTPHSANGSPLSPAAGGLAASGSGPFPSRNGR